MNWMNACTDAAARGDTGETTIAANSPNQRDQLIAIWIEKKQLCRERSLNRPGVLQVLDGRNQRRAPAKDTCGQ